MASSEEKTSAPHNDNITPAPPPALGMSTDSADDAIIANLEAEGQEVGMTWRSFMAAASMALSYNAYLFTLLMPPAILSFINADLGPDATYTWITISWNLGGAIFVTIGGRLSDLLGRRYFFLVGAVGLIIGGIVGATGKSINQMIASGAIFGAGSGFLEMAYGAVQEVVPNEYRLVTLGLFDLGAVIAQVMPLISWVIIKYTGNWRIAYYIIIAFECMTFVFLFFFYNPPSFKTKNTQTGKSLATVLREFDWIGILIFMAGCTLFLIGVNWGGTLHPWTSAATIAPIVVGLCLLIALVLYETYAKLEEPLLPVRLFKQVRHFNMPIIVIAVAGMQYYSNATLWPRLSQLVYASDEISKGLYAEVMPLGTIVGGFIIMLSKKIGHQRWQVMFSICLQTACAGAMSTITVDTPARAAVLTFFISLCTCTVMLNCFALIGFGIVEQRDIGTAAGLASTSRLLFGAVATAIFSNITNNRYGAELPGAVSMAVEGLGLPGSSLASLVSAAKAGTAAAYAAVPGLTPAIQAAALRANKTAYLEGAHLSYLVSLGFGLIACVAAFFIPSIDKRKFTKKTVAVQEADRKALESKKVVQA